MVPSCDHIRYIRTGVFRSIDKNSHVVRWWLIWNLEIFSRSMDRNSPAWNAPDCMNLTSHTHTNPLPVWCSSLVVFIFNSHPFPVASRPGGIPQAGPAVFDDAMTSSMRRIMTAASAALIIACVFTFRGSTMPALSISTGFAS